MVEGLKLLKQLLAVFGRGATLLKQGVNERTRTAGAPGWYELASFTVVGVGRNGWWGRLPGVVGQVRCGLHAELLVANQELGTHGIIGTRSRLGSRRYGRLGSLRYLPSSPLSSNSYHFLSARAVLGAPARRARNTSFLYYILEAKKRFGTFLSEIFLEPLQVAGYEGGRGATFLMGAKFRE